MSIPLSSIRACFEGVVPACLATCATDGTPNVTYVSQSEYVNNRHIALTFQFFNKTRENVLANPRAALMVVHPDTAAMYRLSLHYLRTETGGPLFERMKAKLAGIASLTGMSGVFRLIGSDVYEVVNIEQVLSASLPDSRLHSNPLPELRSLSERLTACPDLECLLNETLHGLQSGFGIEHAMILLRDESADSLYTVASLGYPESGVGSEIPFGQGVIGMAAQTCTPIRISHMAAEYAYLRAMRNNADAGIADTVIPPPGLVDSNSQLAIPISACGRLRGVLFVESPQDLRFSYDDEDALVTLANQLGLLIQHREDTGPASVEPPAPIAAKPPSSGTPLVVKHYAVNQAVFLGDDYLIKGVAGAILWKLLRDYVDAGRDTFSNRELRLDGKLGLPDIADNLEARLILLQRRLNERSPQVRIEKIGRGRFRLAVNCPLQLVSAA